MTFVSSCNSTSIASSSKPHRSARHAHARANNFWFAAEVTAVVLMECTPRGTYNKTPMNLRCSRCHCSVGGFVCLFVCQEWFCHSGRRRKSCWRSFPPSLPQIFSRASSNTREGWRPMWFMISPPQIKEQSLARQRRKEGCLRIITANSERLGSTWKRTTWNPTCSIRQLKNVCLLLRILFSLPNSEQELRGLFLHKNIAQTLGSLQVFGVLFLFCWNFGVHKWVNSSDRETSSCATLCATER